MGSTGSPDVIVVGGGPAGSTAATLIARASHRVVLFDRERFPRFRLGESLMPASYWTLERLGVLERMATSPFPRKHSVQFFTADGRSSQPFYFSDVDKRKSSVTWQVDRAEFDKMLLDNAAAAGVEVIQQANVKDVVFDGERATGVRVQHVDGKQEQVSARVVVDATGQTALISRKLGLKVADPSLRHAALYTRYRGAVRDTGIDEGATLILRTTGDESWFWYIPLPDDHVSVGVVGPIDSLLQGRKKDPRAVFEEEIGKCPALAERIAAAERVTNVGAIRDFSYISRRIAGDGWVMAGDAFGFLDPIYSTGVFLALKSGEMAADSINAALASGDLSGEQLGRHGAPYVAAMESLRKLVYAFYDKSFSVAGFLKRNPQFKRQVVNMLIGNVFETPLDGLFDAMGRECELPESRRLSPRETPN